MTKQSTTKPSNMPAVTRASELAAKAMSRLEAAARDIHQKETERRAEKSVQVVFSSSKVAGFIQAGNFSMQFENGDFAISMTKED